MIWLVLALIVCLGIIGFMGWYIVNSLRKMQFITQSIEDLDLEMKSFEKHLKYIYELDMYYGDQTLEGLITHMKDLNGVFVDFRKDYEIFNGDIDETAFFEEENNAAKTSDDGEDLLFQRP
jgi:hypothetical protein